MSQQIHYRLQVIDGTLFSDSTTVLTPASGSSHTNPFKVTTLPSLSGWLPYMRIPKGERGAFDLKNAGSSVGTYKVEILDKRTGDGNSNRWVSAFIGTSSGLLSLVGRKAFIEETVNGGTTWEPFFVGRINTVDLSNPLVISLTIADSLELLKQKLFTTRPRVDYAVFKSLLPLGLIGDLSNGDDTAKIAQVTGLRIGTVGGGGNGRLITLSTEALNSADNFWPFESTEDFAAAPNVPIRGTNGSYSVPPLRSMIQVGSSFYHYQIEYMARPYNWRNTKEAYTPIEKIQLRALSTNDPDYSPLTAIDGNLVAIKRLWVYRLIADDGQKINTMWIQGSPYTIAHDMLQGKFFPSSSLSVSIAVDSGSLVSLASSQPLPRAVFRVDAAVDAASFLEDNILKPYNLGYTIEPVVSSGVATSQVRFFSTRQPTSSSLSSLVTLDGTDVIADSAKEWSSNAPIGGVDATFYMENLAGITKTTRNVSISPDIEAVRETAYTIVLIPSSIDSVDASYKREVIDMNGVRGVDRNTLALGGNASLENTTAYGVISAQARRFATEYFNRRKSGIPSVRLSTLRSTKTSGIRVGDFIAVEVEQLPNQAIHARGGSRICQVLQKVPNGLRVDFELIDSGVNATMLTPTLGTVTSPSVNTIEFDVTTAEKAVIEVEAAFVVSGGSVPSASSLSWLLIERTLVDSTTDTITIASVPEGRRAFVRIRSTAPDTSALKLSSPWVTSSGIDVANLAAPTSVSVGSITSRAATVSWVNTESDYPLEVWLASPTGTPDTQVTALPAGSSSYRLRGLDRNPSPNHRVGVRYVDAVAGFSGFATSDFVASGDAEVLDAPAALIQFNR